MRLIHTSRLQLETANDGAVPPYAILSHTWGRDEDEVTFKELTKRLDRGADFRRRVEAKAGFAKIVGAAQLAREQGLDYVWIDTCCIDKTSSAELSEAINSMFRWYRDAEVCYAYLADVDAASIKPSEGSDSGDGHMDSSRPEDVKSLVQSRWFSRGWTLQEFIAPSRVLFLNRRWERLGHIARNRANREQDTVMSPDDQWFMETVSEAGNVDVAVLTGSLTLGDVCVAKKMAWAADRKTTRVEDMAYCLLGIFGVNMPLLYGEGIRAFTRLQEEILKMTNDHSLFAWNSPSGPDGKISPPTLLSRVSEDSEGNRDSNRQHGPEQPLLSGLLSPTPKYFKWSGLRLQGASLPDMSQTSFPSTMTNAGLHVHLRLFPQVSSRKHTWRAHEFVAILDCEPYKLSVKDEDVVLTGIRLVALGREQYARVDTHTLLAIPSRILLSESQRHLPTYVYINQQPRFAFPNIVVPIKPKRLHPDDGIAYSLVGTRPRSLWDDKSQSFRSQEQDKAGALGVFTFEVELKNAKRCLRTDVYVGVVTGTQGPGSWDCWCWVDEDGRGHVPKAGGGASEALSQTSYARGFVATVQKRSIGVRTDIWLTVDQLPELGGLSMAEVPALQEQLSITQAPAAVSRDIAELTAVHTVDEARVHPQQALRPSKLIRARSSNLAANKWMLQSWPEAVDEVNKGFSGLFAEYPPEIDPQDTKYTHVRAFVEACVDNDLGKVEKLLDSGSLPVEVLWWWIRVRASFGMVSTLPALDEFNIFHWLAMLGRTRILQRLMRTAGFGSKPTRSHSGWTLYLLALLFDRQEIFNDPGVLHDAAKYPSENTLSPAHFAAAYLTDELTLRKVFNQFVTFDHTEFAQYMTFLSSGPLNAARYRRTPPLIGPRTQYGVSPLHVAASVGSTSAAAAILTLVESLAISGPGSDRGKKSIPPAVIINSRDLLGRSALWHAAAAGQDAFIDRLFPGTSSLPGIGQTRLRPAVDARDDLGRTPLHAACRGGHAAAVRVLLKREAKIEAVAGGRYHGASAEKAPGEGDSEGAALTPSTIALPLKAVHFAALSGSAATIAALREGGAYLKARCEVELDGVGKVSFNAFHIAAANGFADAATELWEGGCDPNEPCSHTLLLTDLAKDEERAPRGKPAGGPQRSSPDSEQRVELVPGELDGLKLAARYSSDRMHGFILAWEKRRSHKKNEAGGGFVIHSL